MSEETPKREPELLMTDPQMFLRVAWLGAVCANKCLIRQEDFEFIMSSCLVLHP